MAKPLLVEIIAYAPTSFYHCTHCEVVWREMDFDRGIRKEQVASALPADIAQEYQAVSDWVRKIFQLYCDQVIVKVIDAASVEGFWKTLRHGLRRYPAVVIGSKKISSGLNFSAAEDEILQLLQMPAG